LAEVVGGGKLVIRKKWKSYERKRKKEERKWGNGQLKRKKHIGSVKAERGDHGS
jgi:hypothetical protein